MLKFEKTGGKDKSFLQGIKLEFEYLVNLRV